MSFKKQVAADFDSVFMNADEYARICTWNGHSLRIVESAVLDTEQSEAQGVNLERKRVVCSLKDYPPPIPAPTEEINLDGNMWNVYDVQKPMAHLIIIIERRVA